jgi:hypothetical protein
VLLRAGSAEKAVHFPVKQRRQRLAHIFTEQAKNVVSSFVFFYKSLTLSVLIDFYGSYFNQWFLNRKRIQYADDSAAHQARKKCESVKDRITGA